MYVPYPVNVALAAIGLLFIAAYPLSLIWKANSTFVERCAVGFLVVVGLVILGLVFYPDKVVIANEFLLLTLAKWRFFLALTILLVSVWAWLVAHRRGHSLWMACFSMVGAILGALIVYSSLH